MNRLNLLNDLPSLFDPMLGRDFFDLTNSSSTGTSIPTVNIKETKDEYKVEVAAPGMAKDDFKIELKSHLLTITSEKKTSHQTNESDGKYLRKEFSYQSFLRSFTLPISVDRDGIKAFYRDGVLYINLPKREEAREKPPKEIPIE